MTFEEAIAKMRDGAIGYPNDGSEKFYRMCKLVHGDASVEDSWIFQDFESAYFGWCDGNINYKQVCSDWSTCSVDEFDVFIKRKFEKMKEDGMIYTLK